MFDAYHTWLGIPPQEQPPNHYRLLGLSVGESDTRVIEESAIRQSMFVRNYQSGPHAKLAAQILTEIATAKRVLSDPVKRSEYDKQIASAPVNAESHREFRPEVDWQLAEAVGSAVREDPSVSLQDQNGSGGFVLVASVVALVVAGIGTAVIWSSGRQRTESKPEVAQVQPTLPSRPPTHTTKVPTNELPVASVKEPPREVAPPPRAVVEPSPRTRAELEAKLKGTRWKWPDAQIPQGWYVLNPDGTVTAGWHKQKGSWEVVSGSTVNIVVMSSPRTPQTFLASPDLNTLTSPKTGEIHTPLK